MIARLQKGWRNEPPVLATWNICSLKRIFEEAFPCLLLLADEPEAE
jgi:hypothetical protein